MVPILDWIFEGVVNWISSIASQLLDAVSGLFLDALGTDMTTMEQYFPFVTKAYEIMQYSAWAILFLICAWQIFRAFGGPISEAENPWYLVVRGGIYGVLIGYAKPIFTICLNIARAPYTSLMEVTMAAEDFTFAGIEQALTNGLTTLVASASVVGLILILILLIALGWNYFKLLLEAVERYIVVGVMCYTSPLAFSMGGSKATNNVFKSWCRMVGSQLLLLVMNVWFLRGFASSAGQFIGNGGALTNGNGSIFLWMFCALAYLKCAQRFDSYLASIGLNVAQTGSSMAMEMMMAARVISGVGSGARSAGSVFGRTGGGATATGTGAAATGFAAGFASRFNPNSYVRDAVVDGGTRMGFSGGAGFVGRTFGGMAARNGATLTGDSISSVASRAPGVSGTIAGDIADRSLSNYMPHMSGFQTKGTQITGGHISTTATAPNGKTAEVDMYSASQFEKPEVPHSVVTASDGSKWYQMASGEGRGAFYDAPNFGGVQPDTPQNMDSPMGDQPAQNMDGTAAPVTQMGTENAEGQTVTLGGEPESGMQPMGEPMDSSSQAVPGETADFHGAQGIVTGDGQMPAGEDQLQQDTGITNLGIQEPVQGAVPTEGSIDTVLADGMQTLPVDQQMVQDTPSEMGGMPMQGTGELSPPEMGGVFGMQSDSGEQNAVVPELTTLGSSDPGAVAEGVQMPLGIQPDGDMLQPIPDVGGIQIGDASVQSAELQEAGSGNPLSPASVNDTSAPMGDMDLSDGGRFFGSGTASDISETQGFGGATSGTVTEIPENGMADMHNPVSPQPGGTPEQAHVGSVYGNSEDSGMTDTETPQGETAAMLSFIPADGMAQFHSEQMPVSQSEQPYGQMVSDGIPHAAGNGGAEAAPSVQEDPDTYVQQLSGQQTSQQDYVPESGYSQPGTNAEHSYGSEPQYIGSNPGQGTPFSGNDQPDPIGSAGEGSFFGGSREQQGEPDRYQTYTEAPLVAATFPAAQEGTTLRTVGEGLIEASSPDGGNTLWYNSAFYQEPDAPHGTMEAANGVPWFTMQQQADAPHFELGDAAAAYNQAAFQNFMPGYETAVSQVDGSHRQDGHFEVRHADGSGTAFYDTARFAPPRGDYRVFEDAKGSQWYAIRGEAAVERKPVFENGQAVYDGDKLKTVSVETVRYKQTPARYAEPKKRGDIVKKPPRRKI